MSFKCTLRISHHRMKQVLNKFRIKWCLPSLFFSSCHIIAHPVRNFRSNPSSTGAVQQHYIHVSLLYMKHFLICRYKINTSSFSKQLPTLILFQDGKEKIRRPAMSAKGTVLKHTFTKVSKLNQLYMSLRVTNQQNDCVLSKDSDHPGHSPSLIRVFAVRMKKH